MLTYLGGIWFHLFLSSPDTRPLQTSQRTHLNIWNWNFKMPNFLMPKIKATANITCTAGKFWCQYRQWKSFFNIIYWSSEKIVKLQIFPRHHSWQILLCLSGQTQDGHLLATRTVSLASGKAYRYQKRLLWVATGTSHYGTKEKIKIKTKCFQMDF